jgi:hypothetical protein
MRFCIRKGKHMKFLLKLFILGLLFVTLPTVARDCHKKCDIVGTFAGLYVEGNHTVMQFHEDGTVAFTNSGRVYFGTWSCKGNNCFEFCGVSGSAERSLFTTLKGTLCFDANCNRARATGVLLTSYSETDICLANPVASAQIDLNICRVDC